MSDFLGFTGQSYAEFLASSPLEAAIYMITKKLLGVFLLLTGILIVMSTRKSYSKGEKGFWYALLITGTMLWGKPDRLPYRNRVSCVKYYNFHNRSCHFRYRNNTSNQGNLGKKIASLQQYFLFF